jgi:hypothetical protein
MGRGAKYAAHYRTLESGVRVGTMRHVPLTLTAHVCNSSSRAGAKVRAAGLSAHDASAEHAAAVAEGVAGLAEARARVARTAAARVARTAADRARLAAEEAEAAEPLPAHVAAAVDAHLARAGLGAADISDRIISVPTAGVACFQHASLGRMRTHVLAYIGASLATAATATDSATTTATATAATAPVPPASDVCHWSVVGRLAGSGPVAVHARTPTSALARIVCFVIQ